MILIGTNRNGEKVIMGELPARLVFRKKWPFIFVKFTLSKKSLKWLLDDES